MGHGQALLLARQIPIRLLFNEPDLNLRAEYALFDRQTARPLCVGDGEQCKRRTREGMETLPCLPQTPVHWPKAAPASPMAG